ncbi:tetraacyldisaccharide 4'-kinase [uncultured Lacinutrix sp.]|uniref:tetraacyldisaccharide 4'-kinase n=1 Tax=uncultured Lacinutrix sp. TaxID=574032 RepID=UPI00261ECC82|nr:tetraacyldisaccharide 4'-kinase [uncultured Lacinutrix sp.]
MKLIRILLFPIVPVYYIVTWLRNTFYDTGIKKSKSYNFPIICVGNLSAGGTGKTPMVEYLIRLLKDHYKIATLSRGYGRNTKGYVLANNSITAKDIGDEPYQFYHKFNETIQVSVDENRQHGIATLQNSKNQPEIILLDDAYQHRKVTAGLNILLSTYNQPFYNDIVLPTGNLREPRNGSKRAHIIVITKCPDTITDNEKLDITKRIKPKAHQQVFFSSIAYSNNVNNSNESKPIVSLSNFTLVTGIANAKPLVNFLESKNLKFNHLEFKDHHEFSTKDIEMISKEELIITTEKDYMRLKNITALNSKLYYLPIESTIDRPEAFNKVILDFASS